LLFHITVGNIEHHRERAGEEMWKQGGFRQLVGTAGSDEVGSVLEFGLQGTGLLGEIE
jgi:hypothetical protein